MPRTTPLAAALMLTVAAGTVVAHGVAGTQAVARPVRVGILDAGGAATDSYFRAFFKRLRELGWVDGQNLAIEILRAEGNAEVLPALASELVQRRVNVIVTSGTTAIQAARQATDTIPIVMAGGGDPVASGLIRSLARPGGNITGVSLLGEEIVPKGLSLLREVVPRAKRVDLLANRANPANAFFERITAEAAQRLGVGSRLLEVRSPAELERAIAGTQADAILALPDPMFRLHAKRIADAAIKRRLPLASFGRPYVEAGSLMSYAVSFEDVYRRAAEYTDRILKGANPAELPVEQPTRYELIFNLKTARALRLTIPPSLLQRADQVFE
ncbi:MAG: ABC transporter substrate-binding protein [Candidatus Rokuibacteriota bacterium]